MERYFAPALLTALLAAAHPVTAQEMDTVNTPNKAASIRTLNTHHAFRPPATRREWETRAERLRKQILFSAGLWPLPERTALDPIWTGREEIEGCIIEKVAIQTLPGFYLCGNLYRPAREKGPFPAIANPHGHTNAGRLEMMPDVEKADPAASQPAPGRNNLVAIGVNLARQGFVVFAYDMVGYNDTDQFADHRKVFAGLRPWLWGASLMGLQLWNSMRAVDFLESLPYVDRSRIGATGGSGGGSQTFLLTAVDKRIAAAAPVNMVSHYMQGGCLCENGPGLRLGTDNAEIAAMAAPRPLLLVAATGDWTRENPREEWPAIRQVYELYGAPERTAVEQFNYEHNYNRESREAVYRWFARWLNPAALNSTTETPFELQPERLRVWSEDHPRPADAASEDGVLERLIARSEEQLRSHWPSDAAGLRRFREVYGTALELSLAIEESRATSPPATEGPKDGDAVLLVCSSGDAHADEIRSALHNYGLQTVTLIVSPDAEPEALWKDFYTCYNRTPAGEAVQEVLDIAAAARAAGIRLRGVVGTGKAGAVALLAAALDGDFQAVAVDLNSTPWERDESFIPHLYAPGLRRAGDLRSAAILCRGRLMLHNAGQSEAFAEVLKTRSKLGADTLLRKSRMMAAEIARELARLQ